MYPLFWTRFVRLGAEKTTKNREPAANWANPRSEQMGRGLLPCHGGFYLPGTREACGCRRLPAATCVSPRISKVPPVVRPQTSDLF